MIYAHIRVSPHHPIKGRRGLHKDVTQENGYRAIIARDHGAYVDEAKARGISLGRFLFHPWGRDIVPANWWGGWTSQRLDQLSRATREGYGWLTAKLEQSLEGWQDRTILYVGGHPIMTLADALLGRQYMRGVGIVCDGAASQSGGVLLADLVSLHREGCRVWVEANRRNPALTYTPQAESMTIRPAPVTVPCVARHDLWGTRQDRYRMSDAPRGSLVWFRNGVNTEEEWATLKRASKQFGLDCIVNISETADRPRLWRTVG